MIGCSLLSSSVYGGSGVYCCGVFGPDDSISDKAGYVWPLFGGLTLTRLTFLRLFFTWSDTPEFSSTNKTKNKKGISH